MSINNEEELAEAVAEAGRLVQEIQNYVGRDFSRPARLRFPRGYLRTASQARRRVAFLNDRQLQSNIAYTLQLADVQHWLLVRTDLSGMAKEMVIKMQIFLLGTVIESITKVYLRGTCGGNFKRRTTFLLQEGYITEDLQTDVEWIWDLRNNMHLFQLEDIEWSSEDYTVANHNRAVRAFRELLDALSES